MLCFEEILLSSFFFGGVGVGEGSNSPELNKPAPDVPCAAIMRAKNSSWRLCTVMQSEWTPFLSSLLLLDSGVRPDFPLYDFYLITTENDQRTNVFRGLQH